MKAKVVEIQSRSYRCGIVMNPYRMIALQFDLGLVEGGPIILRLPENKLGIVGLNLDDEIFVNFTLPEEGIQESEQDA